MDKTGTEYEVYKLYLPERQGAEGVYSPVPCKVEEDSGRTGLAREDDRIRGETEIGLGEDKHRLLRRKQITIPVYGRVEVIARKNKFSTLRQSPDNKSYYWELVDYILRNNGEKKEKKIAKNQNKKKYKKLYKANIYWGNEFLTEP